MAFRRSYSHQGLSVKWKETIEERKKNTKSPMVKMEKATQHRDEKKTII